MTAPPNFLPFRPTTETWTSYINRFECIMDATNLLGISPNRKKAYFLSFCGATIFDTATALLAPQTVKAVTLEELQESSVTTMPQSHHASPAAMPSGEEAKWRANLWVNTWWLYDLPPSNVGSETS
ncbi:hypothetical protein E2320_014830 [Naja naja]|nr:hypothetical protein E2320_014830 [Naja naja]